MASQPPVPRSVGALEFAAARAPELRALLPDVAAVLPTLPRRLRRRAGSHAPFTRLRRRPNAARPTGVPLCRAARRHTALSALGRWHAKRFRMGCPWGVPLRVAVGLAGQGRGGRSVLRVAGGGRAGTRPPGCFAHDSGAYTAVLQLSGSECALLALLTEVAPALRCSLAQRRGDLACRCLLHSAAQQPLAPAVC